AAAEQEAQTVDKAHGRVETRRLRSTTLLNGYLDWQEVGQVFEVERVRGKPTVEVVYGITSLGREQADARRLLELVRGHGAIETRLHYVGDETLGEARCGVRTGRGPEVLALIRNVAVHLLEDPDQPRKAAATRR